MLSEMVAEREIFRNNLSQERWILTPNFLKLLLGTIESRGQISTNAILETLQKAKKRGRDQNFPPYFDPRSSHLREILDQLEENKLLMHARRTDIDDDVWVLTQRGMRSISPAERREGIRVDEQKEAMRNKPKTTLPEPIIKVQIRESVRDTNREEQRRLRQEQMRIIREEQRRERVANARLRREERERMREKQRKEHLEEIQRTSNEQREARRLAMVQEIAAKEQERAERKRQREQQNQEKRLRAKGEKQRTEEAKREEQKKQAVAPAIKEVETPMDEKGIVSDQPKDKDMNAIEENQRYLRVKRVIKKSLKKLREKGYKSYTPFFREGEGQGMQVFLSPKGEICYKIRDTVHVIDLDVALEVYGEEMITQAAKNTLKLRGIR